MITNALVLQFPSRSCSAGARRRNGVDAPAGLPWVLAILCFFMLITGPELAIADKQQAQPRLPLLELKIKDKTLQVEVAASGQQRYMGLSFREQLAQNEGMLFVFESERELTFTMRNTLIPLSIAYISSDLVINEIHDMDVGPDQLFPSRKKARFALEVNQGWFERNGIKAGDRISRQ